VSKYLKLWRHLSRRRHLQVIFLLMLMFLASFAEVISVGMVLPFLGVLVSPDSVFQHELMQPIIKLFDLNKPADLISPLTFCFITAVLLAGLIRLTLLYTMTYFSYLTGADLSNEMYQRSLYQDYEVHLNRNSSEVINGIITKSSIVIGGVINPILVLVSSVILISGVTITLLFIDTVTAFIAASGFMLIYFFIGLITKNRLEKNSNDVATESSQMVKSLQEGLGSIRDVIIDNSQSFYANMYQKSDLKYRLAMAGNVFIGACPRYFTESLGMVLLTIIAFSLSKRPDGIASTLPLLGALALGAQRILPVLQQGYNSYASITGSKASLIDVLDLLNQPLPLSLTETNILEPIKFNNKISLNDISFRYARDKPWVLRNLNLEIKKGSTIGIIGKTGVGKTTLVDIIMGLLAPELGSISVDNKTLEYEKRHLYRSKISHVSQSIYLSDSSIMENIAFGVDQKDIILSQVEEAARKAHISLVVENWPKKYNTQVGERGTRISGGQRQRIGIARALYKNSDILVLDEATSALDSNTEEMVMKSIKGLSSNLTIIMIAHRLSSLKNCDHIITLNDDGKVENVDINNFDFKT